VCPIIRHANMLDLDGRCDGEVEPFIPAAARINKTAFDRLVTQHFSSWKVRTVAGMAQPDDDESVNRKKLEMRQEDLLVAEDPDTKFGTLDETRSPASSKRGGLTSKPSPRSPRHPPIPSPASL
jgi:hypothetical protein